MTMVLIVDDDAVYRHLHSHVLRSAGHGVVQADCVGAALAALDSQHFDLIVSDYVLPDGNGLDLLDHCRDLAAPPRFVLVTGKSDAQDLADARITGVDGYLTKPARSADLLAVVTFDQPSVVTRRLAS
jgi:two-component system response regulator HydG